MNKLVKISGIIVFILLGIFLYLDEYRSFYCLSNDKYLTVWKRLGGACYIIPGKYYGVIKPSGSYVKTVNWGDIDIIWINSDSVLVAGGEEIQIFNNVENTIKMANYSTLEHLNDSLYTTFDGRYMRYKDNIDYISINIKEGYARSKNGKVR